MAAPSYAGDTLPGHPPIPIDSARRARARGGVLLGLVAVLVAVAARARVNPGLLVDALGAVLVAAGVAVTWGTGPGLIAAGLGVLAISSFGDAPAGPDGP